MFCVNGVPQFLSYKINRTTEFSDVFSGTEGLGIITRPPTSLFPADESSWVPRNVSRPIYLYQNYRVSHAKDKLSHVLENVSS